MRHFRFCQKGSVVVLMAVLLPTILSFTGLAIDFGNVYIQQSHMQNTADAAALAGATKLGISNDAAQTFAETYITKNTKDTGETVGYTFSSENTVKKIRVDITKNVPLFFLQYFGVNTMSVTVHAIGSYNGGGGDTLDIFDYSIISGGDGTFYLLGDWSSGGNKFNGPIHVNGKFQFDKNSENGYGTDNIPSSGNQINAPITISANKYDIGGLNKPANQVLADKFSYGKPKIDITQKNPEIKAKIDSLTNKANTFSTSHPANVSNGIDAFALTTPLYVNGNLGSGNSTKNIVPRADYSGGIIKNDIVIVATGDISLSFSSVHFSSTATITLISLTGNIFISGGDTLKLNALAPQGSITVSGGGTTINGYLIGQSISLGQGNRAYENPNSNGSGGSGGKKKSNLIE